MLSRENSWQELLPPRRLPLCYLAFSTLCLLLALAGAIRFAQDFTGFYYHPRILALTHLITLGWISGNILGFLYVIGPMALRAKVTAKWLDIIAFWIYVIGVSGMVSHFWISHDSGMAYSAGCVYLTLLFAAAKWFFILRKSKAPGHVKCFIAFAFSNLLVAASWGLLVAINKSHPFLTTLPAPNILAHSHMAAIGWAMFLVFGVAYRLLPMFIPGEPAKGKLPWIGAIIMECGVIGLFVSLLRQSNSNLYFGFLITAGIFIFLHQSIRTALHAKPVPPPEPARPDFSMLHAVSSFLCLMIAVLCGLALTRMAPTEASLRLALVYAFLALVGFLSQIIVGMKPKILSIFSWYFAFHKLQDNTSIPRPIDMPVRSIQATIFTLWVLGIPLFGFGILQSSRILIVAGSVSLFAAALLDAIHSVLILRHRSRGLKSAISDAG
jgi:hypothetical protein